MEQAQEQRADDHGGQERDYLKAPDLPDDFWRVDLVVIGGRLSVHTPKKVRVEGISETDRVASEEHRRDRESGDVESRNPFEHHVPPIGRCLSRITVPGPPGFDEQGETQGCEGRKPLVLYK